MKINRKHKKKKYCTLLSIKKKKTFTAFVKQDQVFFYNLSQKFMKTNLKFFKGIYCFAIKFFKHNLQSATAFGVFKNLTNKGFRIVQE